MWDASLIRGGLKVDCEFYCEHDQARLWRHSLEENHLCQQPFGDWLNATNGLAKSLGLGGTYSVFDPICPLTLPMLRDAIHTHFVTLIGKWMISFLPTHPVFLSAIYRDVTKLLYFNSTTLPGLSARCLTLSPSLIFYWTKTSLACN